MHRARMCGEKSERGGEGIGGKVGREWERTHSNWKATRPLANSKRESAGACSRMRPRRRVLSLEAPVCRVT